MRVEIVQSTPGNACERIIIIPADRLFKIHRNLQASRDVFAGDNWPYDQGYKNNEHDKVEDGETNDSSFAQL